MVDVWHLVVYLLVRIFQMLVDSLPSGLQVELSTPSWLPTFVQAGSSVLLIAITGWYAVQTWRSTNLARRQMAFEIRRRHTDTLQEKTATWREHLPEVHPTRVSLPDDSPNPEGDFTLYPAALENDPTFDDFLDNHAEDVARLTTEIADQITSYEQKRAEFVENTNLVLEGRLWSLLEPEFYEWLFERIVLVERGLKTEGELKDDLRDAFMEPRVEGSATFYPGDADQHRQKDVLIYHRTHPSTRDPADDTEHQVTANRIVNIIDCLDGLEEYPTAVEASEILDELEANVAELERLVVKYDEMVRIPGDCEYVSSTIE